MADSGEYDQATLQRRYAMAQALMDQGREPVKHWAQGLSNIANSALGGYEMSRLDDERRSDKAAGRGELFAALGLPAPTATPEPSQGGFQKIAALLSGNGSAAPAPSPAGPMAAPDAAPISAPQAAPISAPVAAPVRVASAGPVPEAPRTPAEPMGDIVRTNPDGTIAGNMTAPTIPSPAGTKIAQTLAPPPTSAVASGGILDGVPNEKRAQIATMLSSKNSVVNALGQAELSKLTTPKTVQSLGEGYIWKNGKVERAYTPDEKTPTSVSEFEYGQKHPEFTAQQLAKTKAGAAQLNNQNNIDMNSGQTYDKQLAEGLGKSHAALANGVEDAQTRARDVAAMQGAVDAIQKNGGTTGGLAPAARLELQKSINAGAAAIGIEKPFNEGDLSDKEFLTKFNRSMAGAQAKNAVGSRVTNFEMSNFLKANPGLDMTLTGNQRLLGIQGQIEERNIAVGNAIRSATAQAISKGQKIDPVTVQKIVTDYDEGHHIKDAITGQDLTQSYALPEFQNANATNTSMAGAHSENLKTMEKTVGGKTYVQRDGNWYVK